MDVLIISLLATTARFALDPIGWVTIAGGAVVFWQLERPLVIFLLAGAMTFINAVLVAQLRADYGLGAIPLQRNIIIFVALTVFGFVGYAGMMIFKRSRPPAER